jgi:hypothetical protein
VGPLKDALLRAEKAEAIARKLSKVLKIRELQMEKQSLETSNLNVKVLHACLPFLLLATRIVCPWLLSYYSCAFAGQRS